MGIFNRSEYDETRFFLEGGSVNAPTIQVESPTDKKRRAGKKGGASLREKMGSDHFSEMGKKGGTQTSLTHGPDFYRRIGKIGGSRGKGSPKTKNS